MSIKSDILSYAKNSFASFEKGGVSSNEIRFFDYEDKKYIVKKPFMLGKNLSPFWQMMKNVFHFTIERQNAEFDNVYRILRSNPHIQVAPFVVADEDMMIYEFVEGKSLDVDEFPKGNAYRLGQYIGYNHQISYENCGILDVEDVTDFFSNALLHMEKCINEHWNTEDELDRKMRHFFEEIKKREYRSSKYSLMMVDISADQFLYDGDDIVVCVDLDAYVIGPVEWELSILRGQIDDWESFKVGYETYQSMSAFEELSEFFYFLMALNSYGNKSEIDMYWSRFLEL